jgi:predicted nucleotidyltransferase
MDESLKQDMNKISLFLRQEIGAQALILCGSRSVGDYKNNSDWDMKILTSKEFEFSPHLEGYDFDISCHDPQTHFTFEEFGWK